MTAGPMFGTLHAFSRLMAHFWMMGDTGVDDWAKWAQLQKEPITSETVELEFG